MAHINTISNSYTTSTVPQMMQSLLNSAFNTIVPSKLITKLRTLGLNSSLCNWIMNFLTGHPQVVSAGNNTSARCLITGNN